LARHGKSAVAGVIELAEAENCMVSAVRATHERFLTSFGAVSGQPVANRLGVYHVDTVLEKPTPTIAEQALMVPGLRAGHYLAFFGMHVLTAGIYPVVGELLATRGDHLLLSEALALIAKRERYLAVQVEAERYDLEARYGLLNAQLAIALAGRDRDEVLTSITALLAAGAAAQ
jgi:UTP--glucose-1-phosphate uridylyltransferase